MPKPTIKFKAADIAAAWNISPGRVSQLVAEGMPATSLAGAKAWRRRNWSVEHSGPMPEYLLERSDRVTLEQDVFDRLVYQHGVSPLVASEVCFIAIYCRRRDYGNGSRLHTGKEREFSFETGINEEGTWFAPMMANEPHECGLDERPGMVEEFLKSARDADLKTLQEDPIE